MSNFDLKTQPWFIKTDTPEERIAAQKWLFRQGIYWSASKQNVIEIPYAKFLTNIKPSGEVKQSIFWGDSSPHSMAQEIKLTYKTTVTDVQWPTNPNKAKADKLRAKIARLDAKLKELES